jgi:2-polyprenyl-3-methyl-5-hydroxy-6-metoxy-1,4-benzoquinol methylase
MRTTMRYSFEPVAACDMCGSTRFRMLGMRLGASQGLNPRKAEGIAVTVKRCRDCSLIFPDPLPVPANLADHYDLPPDDYWTTVEPWTPDYFASQIDDAKRLLPFRPGMTALDIGVGQGKGMRSLVHADFDAWGIEPSEPFRAFAIDSNGLDPDRVQLAPIEDAEFTAGQFDFITFGAVLEHLAHPSAALERAFAWLKPGGLLHAEVPSSKWLGSRLINSWFRMMGTNYVTHLSPMHAPFHLFEFAPASFVANGQRLGYSIAEHQFDACGSRHIPDLLRPLLRSLMVRTGTAMQLTVYLRKE